MLKNLYNIIFGYVICCISASEWVRPESCVMLGAGGIYPLLMSTSMVNGIQTGVFGVSVIDPCSAIISVQ
jgi:hypothetical protein